MRNRVLMSFVLALLTSLWAFAQDRTISGTVKDDQGQPLPGASVYVKDNPSIGTVTDANGSFTLTVPEGATLVVDFVGYQQQQIPVGTQTSISVSLIPIGLEEVVVVAYGELERAKLTYAVSKVGAETFKDQPITSMEQAIQGRAAGVQIVQNSGTPGAGISVRVRGSSSISASNEPLYVVDGVPINTGNYSAIGVGNQQTNALAGINPNDIESIEILKDASAAALYGSRASNGVVLITTKKGREGKTRINVNHYTGIQEAWRQLKPLTGPQYIQLLTEMYANRYVIARNPNGSVVDGIFSATWQNEKEAAAYFYRVLVADLPTLVGLGTNGFEIAGEGTVLGAPAQPGVFEDEFRSTRFFRNPELTPSTNWQQEIFRQAPISNTELSLSGGDKRTQYYISGSYFKQEGTIKGSGFERGGGRFNIDHAVSDKLKVNLNVGFTRSINNRINNDNNIYGVLSTALLNAPDLPVRWSDGTYAVDPASSIDNPLAQALEPTNLAVYNRLIGSTSWSYELIKGLKFTQRFGLDFLYFREDRFIPTTTRQGLASNGEGNATTSQDLNWLNENILSFNRSFGDHALNALVGLSVQESRYQYMGASATNFPGNDIRWMTAGAVKADATSSATSWALVSYFSRVNYNYQGKYFLDLSARIDGSSRFGPNNRYGFFPAASAAWRISEEDFMSNVSFLSDLKLRAGVGVTGNQEIGNFGYLALFGAGADYLQQGGLAPAQLANPDLKWETTTQYNAGLDIGLFNRVNLSVDYFVKQTQDLLLSTPIPATSGFTSILRNVGGVESTGWEFTLSATPLGRDKAFQWTSDFNISFIKNKVTNLPDDVPPFATGFANWVEEGQPIGSFRGYVVEGLFQTQDEINALNANSPTGVYQSTRTSPGDIKFKDLNGDGVITSDDQTIIGSALPDFFGGWTNTFKYKNLDLMVFLQYSYGNEIYNNTRAFFAGMNGIFGQGEEVLKRWTPENPNTDVPRAVFGDPNNNRRTSTRWIEDGSYLRVKNVALGYTLSPEVLRKLNLSNLRIYIAAQNLFTFTNYSGLDPEVNTFGYSNTSLGTDFLTYPNARTYMIGVNLGL